MRKILYALCLCLLLCSACNRQAAIRDTALVQQAEAAYQAGAYENAITDASSAIKLQPTAQAYWVRAQAYLAKGNDSKAFADLNSVLNLNPNQAEAFVQRGAIYQKLQQYDKAIADLTKALQLPATQTTPSIYVQRGNAYVHQGQFTQALADFNAALQQAGALQQASALQQAGQHTDAYLGRAQLFHLQGEDEQAIADYTQALQSVPDLATAYAGRGDAYFFVAQYQKALNDYEQAIRFTTEPKALTALYTGQADTLFMLGQYETATTTYTKALALNPRDAEAYAGRGDALIILRQFEQAGLDFNAAIKLDPTRAQGYVKRGDLYFLRGKYEAAIEDYTTALKLGIADETRRRQVEQQRAEVQAELRHNPNEANSSLPLCTWFARAQFLRTTRLNQAARFRQWQQTYGAHTLTALNQPGLKAWLVLLRTYQPYQKQFIKQWTTLTPPLAAQALWEKELNGVQQESIAVDQMLASANVQDMAKFTVGLTLWQEALQSRVAAEGEMVKIQTQCLH